MVLARFGQEDAVQARARLTEGAVRLSADDPLLAFVSEQGDTVGMLIRSDMTAAQIIYSLTSDYKDGDQSFVLVVGIGEDWSGVGAQASWEWLRERRATSAVSNESNAGYRADRLKERLSEIVGCLPGR